MGLQVRSEQLEGHLARQLAPLYVIHGEEPLLSLEAADAVRARARSAGCTERVVLVVERGFSWASLEHAAADRSLFADRKLVELRMPSGKPDDEGSAAIEAYCARLVEENVTLVSLPRLAKAAQSSRWFSALADRGVIINVFPVDRSRLPMWIAARLARQQQQADDEALRFIAECVEGNLLAAHQEIQKLALLCPPGKLSREEVRSAVLDVSRFDAFQLAEAMLAGDVARVERIVDHLENEGEQPPRVLWALAEELRAVGRVGAGFRSGRAMADLMRENRIWGDARQALVGSAARRVDPAEIAAALLHAGRIDRLAKGIGRGSVWEELLALALRLSPAAKAVVGTQP